MFKPEYVVSKDRDGKWHVTVSKNYSHGSGYVGGQGYGFTCATLLEALQFVVKDSEGSEEICFTLRQPGIELSVNDNKDAWIQVKKEYDERPPGIYM
jgi:hypothetical protein